MKMIFSKRIVLVVLFGFLVGNIYAENRTGKVLAIESFSAGRDMGKCIYIDTNSDNIIDALVLLSFSELEDIVVNYYINVGSVVVYNFTNERTETGIFGGDVNCIISVDGITKAKMFPYRH